MLFEQSEFIEWMKLWASHNLSKRRGGQTAWVYCSIIYQPTVTDWAFAVSAAGVNIKAKEGVPLTKGKNLSFSGAHIFLGFSDFKVIACKADGVGEGFWWMLQAYKKSIQPHHKRQSLNLKNGVFKVFFLTPKFTGPISQLQIKKD